MHIIECSEEMIMHVELTRHAGIRAQQRGIPSDVVHNLYRFGEATNSRGATSVSLSREALCDAAGAITPQELQRLMRYRGVFLIVGDCGRVVTAARGRQKRYR
jgi:hypothetical protein